MTRSNRCRWWPRPRSSAAPARQVRVLLDPAQLASRNLSPAGIVPMLQQANRQFRAGGLDHRQPRSAGGNRRLLENRRGGRQRGHRRVQRASGLSARSGGHRGWREETSQYVLFGSWQSKRDRGTRRHPQHRQAARCQCHLRRRRGAAQGGPAQRHDSSPPT